MTETEKAELRRAYKDAAIKLAALPARLRDEEQQAEADGREPIPIQPLTTIAADLLVKAMQGIAGDMPSDLAEIVGAQSRACGALGTARVCLLSEHVKRILDAAGLGEANAQVPR